MKRFILAALFGLSALHAGATVVNGRIFNMEGDGDGLANDLKISRVQFDVTAGTRVFFDSLVWESTGVDLNGDGVITGFDNYMRLFSGVNLLTSNDDSSNTFGDGSVHGYDSVIDYTFVNAGTYLITLGQLSYDTTSALRGYQANRAFFDYTGGGSLFGAWRLTMTASNGSLSRVTALDDPQNVPEPGTLPVIGLGLAGIALARRRKNKNSA